MNRKALSLVAVFVFIMLALSSLGPVRAQSNAPQVALGQPGTSFRYVQTFGEAERPYFADFQHLNSPVGLFVDGSNNVLIIEQEGNRLLKYSPTGANLLSIGVAGVDNRGEYSLDTPQDTAVDITGNIWLVDRQRAVEYSSTGTFLRELPPDDPWNRGNDNTHFNNPGGIAFDGLGHMFVSDNGNHRVQVYTFSGGSPVYDATIGVTGESGNDNNHFYRPARIAVDSNNQLYVVDNGNSRVQRCSYSGGWSCSTFDSGLNDPQGIAVDGSNNIYIANTGNHYIRKCTPTGVCSNFIAVGGWITDVALDSNGNIYSCDYSGFVIQEYTSSGTPVGVFAGTSGIPYLTDNYHFNHPRVAIDKDNNILVIEGYGQRLIKLNSAGVYQWSVGEPGIEGSDNAHFNYPHGVAVDKNGYVYVADNTRVQIFTPGGDFSATLGTGSGSGDYQFCDVTGIAVDNNGNIYVSDACNQRVQIYNSSRVFTGRIGATGICASTNDRLCWPIGLTVDSAGNIYVADSGNTRVQKFNSSHAWQLTLGITGSGGGDFSRFNSSEDVAVDAKGRIYVADMGNQRVQIFDSAGAYLTTIGGSWGMRSGEFRNTSGVDLDSFGNVFVADFRNGRIQKFALGVSGWRQININGFGQVLDSASALEVFNDQLYAATSTWSGSGGRIYRSSTGTDWNPVSAPGFGDGGTVPAILDMAVFTGKLYAATGWGNDNNSARIYRTDDGTTWNPVVSNGFGNTDNLAITILVEYENWLYAAVHNQNGAEIWRSATGNLGDWSQVVSGGFNDANNYLISDFAVFNSTLYASARNSVSGDEVWRTNNGTSWEQVSTDGFGDANNNNDPNLRVFNNQLYASLHNDTLGVQLWRSSNGADWEKVVGDGFGNPNNYRATLFVFSGSLYAIASNNQTGFQIWYSKDGTTWHKTGIDGLGDSNNDVWSNNGIAFFNGLPIIATWNGANGGEVWQMQKAIFLPMVAKK